MWRYYADLYCGIVCIKTGGEMNLRATLVLGDDVWLDSCMEVQVTSVNLKNTDMWSNSLERFQLAIPIDLFTYAPLNNDI